MIRFRKPTPAARNEFLAAQARLDFTSAGVGTTAAPPAGYTVDRTRVRFGEGEAVLRAATAALGRWDQFRLGWRRTRRATRSGPAAWWLWSPV